MTLAPARATFYPLAIAAQRCKGCELCIAACPHGVLALDTTSTNVLGHHPIRLLDAGACTSCALCARVCPDAVFTVYAPSRPAANATATATARRPRGTRR